jgi:hypothetical protein
VLLLLTIALVLVAAITLLIGIIGDSLLLIFVSIFCSLGAGATLLVLSSASKKRARETAAPAAAGPAPLESTKTEETKPVVGAETVPTVPSPALAEAAPAEPVAETPAPKPAAAPPATPAEFPIENYDDLKVSEITPLLDGLDLDQLDLVLEREENNKKRATIMNRVNELMDRLEAEEEASAAPAVTETLEPAIPVGDAVATPPAAAAVAQGDDFPIADYDRLSVDDILDRLPALDDEELELVYEREDAGAGRTAILDRVDEILDEREGVAASPAAGRSEEVAQAEEAAAVTEELDAVAAKKAPSKKAAAKKVAAKKVTAKKVAAKKAAPVKAVPVKKVTAKKTAAPKKAAPVKKAAVKKAAVKKAAAAKKAPAKKVAKKSR